MGRRELISLKVKEPVPRDDSIWTVSDINAYTEVKMEGNLGLQVLPDGHGFEEHAVEPQSRLCRATPAIHLLFYGGFRTKRAHQQ